MFIDVKGPRASGSSCANGFGTLFWLLTVSEHLDPVGGGSAAWLRLIFDSGSKREFLVVWLGQRVWLIGGCMQFHGASLALAWDTVSALSNASWLERPS